MSADRLISFVVISVLFFYSIPLHAASSADKIPNQYIVVFKETVSDPDGEGDDLSRRHGLAKGFAYRHALKGFAAVIPPHKLGAVRSDPRVAFLSEDRILHALAQTTPTGIDRVNAEISTLSGRTGLRVDNSQPVDVAVLDTGIDLTHPDLAANIGGNKTFIYGSGNGNDDNGHGTHVAGIIAAVNNSVGVVGVAPKARLWAVKVLNKQGSGSYSTIIKGIDWVTASRTTPSREPIEVVNMSLGGPGSDDGNCGNSNSDALHKAICKSVAAGVTYVVAAGNSAANAAGAVPASYNEVITVSALADSDGQPGGTGPATSYGRDDTFATFSNYGADVDLIAPGVNIYSTYKGGAYAVMSGTSMAAPHAAGAAALYIAANPASTPSQVRAGLIASGVLDWDPATDRDTAHEPRADACRASGLEAACP